MDSIEADDLYEERGAVSFSRPILQGDIFEGIVLPGFGDQPKRVQIVTHPCSMRRGRVINERIQVAPIETLQKVGDWSKFGRFMPLPDLLNDGRWYGTKFVDLTAVAAFELTPERRIASLSHPGIHVLQQRLVWHNTRLTLDLALLRAQSAPILAEAEMQELWVDAVIDVPARTADAVQLAGDEFQEWLSDDNDRRRGELMDEANHAKLRREARIAALERHAPLA